MIETSENMIEIGGNCVIRKTRNSAKVLQHPHLYFREMRCESLRFHKCHKVRQFRNSGLYGRMALSNFGFVLPRPAANRARRRRCSKDRVFLLKSQSGARTLVEVPRNTLTIEIPAR